jgi:hypothetical protein
MLRLLDRGKHGRRKKHILVQYGNGFLALLLTPNLESLAERKSPVTVIYTSFQQ